LIGHFLTKIVIFGLSVTVRDDLHNWHKLHSI